MHILVLASEIIWLTIEAINLTSNEISGDDVWFDLLILLTSFAINWSSEWIRFYLHAGIFILYYCSMWLFFSIMKTVYCSIVINCYPPLRGEGVFFFVQYYYDYSFLRKTFSFIPFLEYCIIMANANVKSFALKVGGVGIIEQNKEELQSYYRRISIKFLHQRSWPLKLKNGP